jgi:nucleoside-diphosphate kinase
MDLYKGIIPDFNSTIDQLVSGPLIALEVRQENVCEQFKRVCGSYNPEKGKTRERDTLRVLYG